MSIFAKQNLNSGRRKLDGEGVIGIYKMCQSGMTQGAIARATGVSVGQVGRILRGESWQGLYNKYTQGLPISPQELTMQMMEGSGAAFNRSPPQGEPSKEEIARSEARFLKMMEAENAPRESVLEVLENRSHVTKRPLPTLEEVEAREREAMGGYQGSGIEKLLKVQEEESHLSPRSIVEQRVGKLLEELK